MSAKNRPLPWWPKSYQADEHVISMTLEAEGAYRRLLDYQWLHGSIPADPKRLAAICKGISPARMTRLWTDHLAVCFHPTEEDPTRLVNHKLERERAKDEAYRKERSESGKKGAAATWGKDGKANGSAITQPEAQPSVSQWPPSPTPSPTQTAEAVPSHSQTSEPQAKPNGFEKNRGLSKADARAGYLQLAREAREAKERQATALLASGGPQ